jgi:spermidine synthase
VSKLYKTAFVLFIFCTVMTCSAETETVEPQDETGFWESFINFFVPHAEKRRILLRKQTQYFQVTVEEDSQGAHHLVFNPVKGSQGIWNPKKPDEIISTYCKYLTLFMTLIEHPPERVLFIGLGVGILPRFVGKHFPKTIIDVVEIDPDIPDIAHKYFAYDKTARTNIIIMDGRDFINRNKHKYDLIIIDAYSAHNIPFQLTTREFYQKMRDALKPNGIISVNIANLGKSQFIASEIKTIKSVFPNLAVYVCQKQSNYIPFAVLDQKIISAVQDKKAEKIDTDLNFSYKMKDILKTRMTKLEIEKMTEDAIILTDDYAPVETMK